MRSNTARKAPHSLASADADPAMIDLSIARSQPPHALPPLRRRQPGRGPVLQRLRRQPPGRLPELRRRTPGRPALLQRLRPRDSPPPLPAAVADPGERRHATVMFSDLTGYTALNEATRPGGGRGDHVGRIKAEATAVIERHGGTVNQFVGDEIMALFGVPLARARRPAARRRGRARAARRRSTG